MTDDFQIPVAFFESLTHDEFMRVINNDSCLDAELIERLWRMTDRQGPRPAGIKVMVCKADVEKLWGPLAPTPPQNRKERRRSNKVGRRR